MKREGSSSPAVVVAGLCAALTLAIGCAVGDQTVPDGQSRQGDIVMTVGNVTVGRGCEVSGAVVLKAGNVEIGRGSTLGGQVRVINGNVELGDSVRCRTVDVENGMIKVGRGAVVGGPVTLTNGLIEVDGGRIEGLVELVRGRLEVRAGSVLAAGLRVESTGHSLGDSSRVVIRAGARVAGPLTAEGRVRLIIEPGADTAGARLAGVAPEARE